GKGRARHKGDGRRALPPLRLHVGAERRPASLTWMEARGGLSEAQLDRLQRGSRALLPRAGIADASDSPEELCRVYVELPLPKALRDRIPARGAPLHPPAFARLGRFPRHPCRPDARARPRLLREQRP